MEKNISEILRELRSSKGATQSDIAKLLGLTTNAYQSYERGISEPSCKALKILADFYGVTTDYLLGRNTEEQGNLDKLSTEFNMTSLEKKIVEEYLSLPQSLRGDMMNFLEKAVNEAISEDSGN